MRRKLLRVALALALLYACACGLACVAQRAFLFPAPGAPPTGPRERLLERTASDGRPARAYDFTEPGDAAVVVWFHGNGELADGSLDLAPALRARGLGSVFAEYRGYGVSKGAGEPDEAGLYADAAAVLDALADRGFGASRIVLVGYSLGSGVAAEMASRGRARAMLLVAPFTAIPAVFARHAPFLPTSLLVRDAFDTLSKARRIPIPVTVVHGTADEVVPFDMGERVARALPRGELVPVPGAHHADVFAVAADAVLDSIGALAR